MSDEYQTRQFFDIPNKKELTVEEIKQTFKLPIYYTTNDIVRVQSEYGTILTFVPKLNRL